MGRPPGPTKPQPVREGPPEVGQLVDSKSPDFEAVFVSTQIAEHTMHNSDNPCWSPLCHTYIPHDVVIPKGNPLDEPDTTALATL